MKEKDYKMDDVVLPSTSRTIRRIPISRKQIEEDEKVVEEYVAPRRTRVPRDYEEPKGSSTFTKIVMVAVVLISIVVIAGAISLVYSKGTLTIEPKSLNTSINVNFTATPNGDGLKYSTITASETTMEVVTASPGTFYQSKAKGSVFIVSTAPDNQELVINTRLQSASGKIYRLQKGVIVPAGKRVSVAVQADEAGVESNLSKALAGNLTIPGFKGSKKFDQFHAELETDLTGGFSGNRNVIDEKIYKETKDRLTAAATDQVRAKLKSQVDPNSTSYESLIAMAIEELPQVSKGTNQSQISIKATAMAYVFDTNSLIKTLGAGEVKKLGTDSFTAKGLSSITMAPKAPIKYGMTGPITINAAGSIVLVGDIPVEQVKESVVGVAVEDINTILQKYDSIAKASVRVSPFWKKSFPSSPNRVTVEVLAEK